MLRSEAAFDHTRVIAQPLVGQRLEVGEHVARASIARDHRGVVRVVEALDPDDVALAAKLLLDFPHAPLGCHRAHIARVDERYDTSVDLPAGGGLEAIGGLHALRGRVIGRRRA